jgi:ketosteroid isomerase-like protein
MLIMTKSNKAASSMEGAGNLVRNFLRTMERRDLDLAKPMLAPDFSMIFPGNFRPSKLEDLVEWSKTRYKSAHKTFDGIDEIETDDGMIVYIYGTLHGERLDGTPYSGIRYIDRFTIRNGKIADQSVWNDMAEESSFRRQPEKDQLSGA